MGMLSLIFGIIVLLIGLPLSLIALTSDPFLSGLFYTGLVLIGIGIFLIKKYDWDKKKSRLKLRNESAIDILRERYAKGEITKEEFEKMKKDLN